MIPRLAFLRRTSTASCLALLICALGIRSANAEFIDVTTGPLGDPGHSLGVAWGDYDGDGDHDILVAEFAGPAKLLRNDGGAWVDATPSAMCNAWSAVWADYDNDGELDLFLSTPNANCLLRNDGGSFVNATPTSMVSTGSSFGHAWGDYDNDGHVDLYVVHGIFTPNKLFRNEGSGWALVSSGPLANQDESSTVAWGDYDDDGDLDLYLPVNSGFSTANKLFRNNGGTWTDVTSGPLGNTGQSMGVAWADYDNDGDLDLYFANGNAANKLLRNDAGTFTDATSTLLGNTGAGRGVAWGDYDNDGDLDLYLVNYGQANKLFRNDGGTFVDGTSAPLGDTGLGFGVAWGDYDNDGDLDLYLANNGANRLFRNDDASGNHWLHIDLVGTASNRSAIGARVRVVAGGVRQVQEVSGGSGFVSQNSLTVEFGLGASTSIDSLVIRWPSGIVQAVNPVPAVDQRITITEATSVAVEERPGAFVLGGVRPNPSDGRSLKVSFVLPSDSPVRIDVFDTAGRRVVTKENGTRGVGGARVVELVPTTRFPPGLYLVRVTQDGRQFAARAVVLN